MIINKYNGLVIQFLINLFSQVKARHIELSLLFSADDHPNFVSDRLVDLVGKVLLDIKNVSLEELGSRADHVEQYINLWPGEHYRLLSSITRVLQPKVVIEIGTATGLSALAIKKYLNEDAKITTFDLIKWQDYPKKCLIEEDFIDGKLEQCIDDLNQVETVLKYRELLESADLIFVDASKDGKLEKMILDNFRLINFNNPPIIIFDDIRLWNMLKIWRDITMPKFDLTSFGHWSGTGIVDWQVK